jgi:flagellin-like protein
MMKKRGISPLIATVLLIGFVVASAAVAFIWTRGFVGEIQEKRGAEAGAQLSCSTDIQITVRDVESNLVIVENQREKIDGFLLVLHGPGGTDTIESTLGVDAGGIVQVPYDVDSVAIGGGTQPQKIDIIPRIKLGRGVYQPCPNQKITWNMRI